MEEKREPGKDPNKDVRGLLSRIASTPGATLEDIGTKGFSLREGEDRQKTINSVREEILRIMHLSISGRPEECAKKSTFYEELFENTDTGKALDEIKRMYESLPEEDRSLGGKIISWEDVINSIPDMRDFIPGINTLTDPKIYFINEKGQLVIGDGCSEPPAETLGKGYFELRNAATRISYIDEDGQVVTTKDRKEIPHDAKIISEKGLITEEEESRINHGQFENKFEVWLERGENPPSVHCAHCREKMVGFEIHIPQSKRKYVGSRCVFRVNLDFEKELTDLDKKS
ncbi:hypothetical protein C0416_02045 [bacterium]|nr:hypothetical protein [bacterium]